MRDNLGTILVFLGAAGLLLFILFNPPEWMQSEPAKEIIACQKAGGVVVHGGEEAWVCIKKEAIQKSEVVK